MFHRKNTRVMKNKQKKIIFIILIAFLTTPVYSQYTVTKAIGRVLKLNGEVIHPGSKLSLSDKLQFSSAHDVVFMVESGKGSLKVTATGTTGTTTEKYNLLLDLLKSAVRLKSETRDLSGRNLAIEETPDAFKTDISINPKLIISTVNKFLFSPTRFNIESGGYFELVEYGTGVHYQTRLTTVKDTLLIRYTDFVTPNHISKNVNFKLVYHNGTLAAEEFIALFQPYFDLTNEAGLMLRTLINDQKRFGITRNESLKKTYAEIYEVLGKPNAISFAADFRLFFDGRPDSLRKDLHALGLTDDPRAGMSAPILTSSLYRSESNLPETFSLRQYAPPVGNQGQYGTCAAWAIGYAARTIANRTNSFTSNLAFSPAFLYNQVKAPEDVNCAYGLSMENALKFLKGSGIIPNNGEFRCGQVFSGQDFSRAKDFIIKDYQALCSPYKINQETIFVMKQILASKQPFVIGMFVPESFQSVNKYRDGGIWYPTSQDHADVNDARAINGYKKNGHAMCVIGYNDKINGGSFEIMNSWGKDYGNEGTVWVNYGDFARFVREAYVINDFEGEATQKLALKGNIQFQLFKDGNLYQKIGVTKDYVNSEGFSANTQSKFIRYKFTSDLHSGTSYKIKFQTQAPCYFYIIGQDSQSVYKIFPHADLNESALIDYSNSSVILPDQKNHIILDDVAGKERMCILISKSALNYEQVKTAAVTYGNIYRAVSTTLHSKLLDIQNIASSNNEIEFTSKVNRNDVLAIFIEFNHID